MKPPFFRSARAFTLFEIMIVVLIVGILSMLAMIALGRIKEKAARTVILNNLRQLYDAKSFYFSDKPDNPTHVDIMTLAARGYITPSVKDKFLNPSSYESGLGWHYAILLEANAPVSAFKGVHPHDSTPTGDMIYYPAPPETGAGGNAQASVLAPPPGRAPAQVVASTPVPNAVKVPELVSGTSATAPVAPREASTLPDLPRGGRSLSQSTLLQALGVKNPDGTIAGIRLTQVDIDPPGLIDVIQQGTNWRLYPRAAAASADPNTVYHLKVQVENNGGSNSAALNFRLSGH